MASPFILDQSDQLATLLRGRNAPWRRLAGGSAGFGRPGPLEVSESFLFALSDRVSDDGVITGSVF